MQTELAQAKRRLDEETRHVEDLKLQAAKAMDRAAEKMKPAEHAHARARSPKASYAPRGPSSSGLRPPPGLTVSSATRDGSVTGSVQRARGSSTIILQPTASRGEDARPPAPPPGVPPKDEKPSDNEDEKEKETKKDKKSGKKRSPPGGGGNPDDGDSSSSTSSEEDDVRRRRPPPPPPTYKMKSEPMKLNAWPTTLQFPAWRRALRSAVAGACDQPILATRWIFQVEGPNVTLEDFAPDQNDPFRALDAKLAAALGKITKGEPARKIGIEAEKAASHGALLTGRQHLRLIYKEFQRDDNEADHAAYSNLELSLIHI